MSRSACRMRRSRRLASGGRNSWRKLSRRKNYLLSKGENMAHPVVHFEIGCKDLEKTKEFYGKLFDWNLSQQGPAAMIAGEAGGIPAPPPAVAEEPHQFTHFYVLVDDVSAHLKKAESLGGKTIVPPIELPNGTFAWMQDPEGNTVGLWKNKP